VGIEMCSMYGADAKPRGIDEHLVTIRNSLPTPRRLGAASRTYPPTRIGGLGESRAKRRQRQIH
jgi:hypothetical protein